MNRSTLQTMYFHAQYWLPPAERKLPIFRTETVANPSKILKYKSTCTLQLDCPPSPPIIFHGKIADTKKATEHYAALQAIQYIKTKQQCNNNNFATGFIKATASGLNETSILHRHRCMATMATITHHPLEQRYSKVVLVDLDNIQLPITLIKSSPSTLFIFFVSRTGTSDHKKYIAQPNCRIKITPIIGKDACDVHICYEAQSLQNEFPNATFAVATKDHFAQILVGLMQRNTWHVCKLDEMEQFLKTTFY